MFKIKYRIVLSEYEDSISGMYGFFQISSNNHTYGDIFSQEIEQHMSKESIYYWLKYFMCAIKELQNRDYVLISDIESYNTWFEIRKENEYIFTSLIHASKPVGTTAVEFNPMPNTIYQDWNEEKTDFVQFKEEVKYHASKYYNELCKLNSLNINNKKICQFHDLLLELIS